MPDLSGAYRETRESLSALVLGLDGDSLGKRVPACPDWSVKDVVAHVTGVAEDVTTGRRTLELDLGAALVNPEEAARRDAVTDEQVTQRRDVPVADVIEEWRKHSETLERMMAGEIPFPAPIPFVEWIPAIDLAAHTHDVRGALGKPGDRESDAIRAALRFFAGIADFRARTLGTPALRIRAGKKEWTAGEGEPVATVTAEPFELFRSLSGRRSPEQVRAYDWVGDPEPVLELFYPYGSRTEPIVE